MDAITEKLEIASSPDATYAQKLAALEAAYKAAIEGLKSGVSIAQSVNNLSSVFSKAMELLKNFTPAIDPVVEKEKAAAATENKKPASEKQKQVAEVTKAVPPAPQPGAPTVVQGTPAPSPTVKSSPTS